jgi:hypothetical protein
MANALATRFPISDESEWFDGIDDDFIDAVVEVGAELPDADMDRRREDRSPGDGDA